jgi:hypothetical protein
MMVGLGNLNNFSLDLGFGLSFGLDFGIGLLVKECFARPEPLASRAAETTVDSEVTQSFRIKSHCIVIGT